MKGHIRSKTVLTLATLVIVMRAIAIPLTGSITHSHAVPLSSQASWNIVPSPNVGTGDNELDNTAEISTTDVWAVGRYTTDSGTNQPLVEQWKVTSWNIVTTPSISVTGWLYGITVVPGTGELWAVGAYRAGSNALTLIEHYNGIMWSIVSSPNVAGSDYLYAVDALSSSNIWAAGQYNDPTG